MELLQIATAWFITKGDGPLLQIATAFLLQSATRFITNYDRYYKVRWLLQIATVQRSSESMVYAFLHFRTGEMLVYAFRFWQTFLRNRRQCFRIL